MQELDRVFRARRIGGDAGRLIPGHAALFRHHGLERQARVEHPRLHPFPGNRQIERPACQRLLHLAGAADHADLGTRRCQRLAQLGECGGVQIIGVGVAVVLGQAAHIRQIPAEQCDLALDLLIEQQRPGAGILLGILGVVVGDAVVAKAVHDGIALAVQHRRRPVGDDREVVAQRIIRVVQRHQHTLGCGLPDEGRGRRHDVEGAGGRGLDQGRHLFIRAVMDLEVDGDPGLGGEGVQHAGFFVTAEGQHVHDIVCRNGRAAPQPRQGNGGTRRCTQKLATVQRRPCEACHFFSPC